MRRLVPPLILALTLASTSICSASYADYGPLYDVLAVRKDFATRHRLPWQVITRIIVVRDYAMATASYKGALIDMYQRRHGRWIAVPALPYFWDHESARKAEGTGVPHDVVTAMLAQMR